MLGFGLSVAAIAMSIVFIALMALMFIIQGSSVFFQKKTDGPKVAAPKAAAPAAPVAVAPVREDNNELTAVIAAAIAASGHQVIVKSISRVVGTSGAAWAATGRTDAMSLRQI